MLIYTEKYACKKHHLLVHLLWSLHLLLNSKLPRKLRWTTLCYVWHELRPAFRHPCSEEFKSLHHVLFLHAYYFIIFYLTFYLTLFSFFKPIHLSQSPHPRTLLRLQVHYTIHLIQRTIFILQIPSFDLFTELLLHIANTDHTLCTGQHISAGALQK